MTGLARSPYAWITGLLLASVLLQSLSLLNADVAWLITAAMRTSLSGEVLYVDVLETNPPAIVWVMSVIVKLAHALYLSPITLTVIAVNILAGVSLLWCARLGLRLPGIIALSFSLTLLAAYSFAQREHLLALCLLPYLLHLARGRVGFGAALFALGGIILKPHFVLLGALLAASAALLHRNWRLFFCAPHLLMAALTLLYGAYLLAYDTTYLTQMVPDLLRWYGAFTGLGSKVFENGLQLLLAYLLPACILLRTLGAREGEKPLIILSLLASAGCIALALLQQKGWSNHWYPAHGFAALALALLAVRAFTQFSLLARVAQGVALFVLASLLFIGCAISYRQVFEDTPTRKLISELRALPEAHSLASISLDLTTAFPAALYAGKQACGPYAHLWPLPGIYAGAEKYAGGRLRLRAPEEMGADEARVFSRVVQEWVRCEPDIILLSTRESYNAPQLGNFKINLLDYFRQSPEFQALAGRYRLHREIGEVAVFVKAD